jgi:hypothetical protein
MQIAGRTKEGGPGTPQGRRWVWGRAQGRRSTRGAGQRREAAATRGSERPCGRPECAQRAAVERGLLRSGPSLAARPSRPGDAGRRGAKRAVPGRSAAARAPAHALAHSAAGPGSLGGREGDRGRAGGWGRGRATAWSRAPVFRGPRGPHAARHLGVGSGERGRWQRLWAGLGSALRDALRGVAGLGLLLLGGGRPRPGAFPRFPGDLRWGAGDRGNPPLRPRSTPWVGGAAGRGVCKCCALAFPHPRLLPGCWRGSLAVRQRL